MSGLQQRPSNSGLGPRPSFSSGLAPVSSGLLRVYEPPPEQKPLTGLAARVSFSAGFERRDPAPPPRYSGYGAPPSPGMSPAPSPTVARARPVPVPNGALQAMPSYQAPIVPRAQSSNTPSGASTPLSAKRSINIPTSQYSGPTTPTSRSPTNVIRPDPRAQAAIRAQPEAQKGLRPSPSFSMPRGPSRSVVPAPPTPVLYPEARGILHRLIELVKGTRLVQGPAGPEVPFQSFLDVVRHVRDLSVAFGPVMEFVHDELKGHLAVLDELFRTDGDKFQCTTTGRTTAPRSPWNCFAGEEEEWREADQGCFFSFWEALFGSDGSSEHDDDAASLPSSGHGYDPIARRSSARSSATRSARSTPIHIQPPRSTPVGRPSAVTGPPRAVATVQGMARWEAQGRAYFRRHARGTAAVVAVGRLLDFLICFCEEYLDESKDNLTDIARAAYKRSLHEHHGFIMRKATGVIMTGMPERAFFVASIGMDSPSVTACMRTLAHHAPPLIDAIRSVERRCG